MKQYKSSTLYLSDFLPNEMILILVPHRAPAIESTTYIYAIAERERESERVENTRPHC